MNASSTNDRHVIFGTGPLGLATMRELLRRGRRVRMVNRSGQAAVPAGVEVVRGDANNPASTRALCTDAAVVYQCAQPEYHRWIEEFPALQAGIVAGVADTAAKLVVVENLYMYGLVDGPLTEDLPNRPTTRKGRLRAQLSETLLAAHQAGRIRVAIARGSDFYGPGVEGSTLGERTFAPALAGKAAEGVGNIDLPHTYTYIDDFGTALVNLGERDEALGQIWHVPNAPTVTTRQVLTMLFAELGQPPKISAMGRWKMRLGGLFIPAAREAVEMLYEFEHPFIVNHDKYSQTFGNHATPLRDGLRATIAWYREQLGQGKVAA